MNRMYQHAGIILMVHARIPMKTVGLSMLKKTMNIKTVKMETIMKIKTVKMQTIMKIKTGKMKMLIRKLFKSYLK